MATNWEEIATLKANASNLMNEVKEVKTMLQWHISLEDSNREKDDKWKDEIKTSLEEFAKEMRNWYTTTREHEEVKTQLNSLKDKLWNINLYILLAVIGAALSIIMIK
jgi:hypothetical protein